MIDPADVKPGLNCLYQRPPMRHPEYGTIVRASDTARYVFVRFLFETTAKACRHEDLFWPPDFCAIGGGNPPGQIFDHNYG